MEQLKVGDEVYTLDPDEPDGRKTWYVVSAGEQWAFLMHHHNGTIHRWKRSEVFGANQIDEAVRLAWDNRK
jgi:hypothetical protein